MIKFYYPEIKIIYTPPVLMSLLGHFSETVQRIWKGCVFLHVFFSTLHACFFIHVVSFFLLYMRVFLFTWFLFFTCVLYLSMIFTFMTSAFCLLSMIFLYLDFLLTKRTETTPVKKITRKN
jgi:hypothetical protein